MAELQALVIYLHMKALAQPVGLRDALTVLVMISDVATCKGLHHQVASAPKHMELQRLVSVPCLSDSHPCGGR